MLFRIRFLLPVAAFLVVLGGGRSVVSLQPPVLWAVEGGEDEDEGDEVDEWSNQQKDEAENILERIKKLMSGVQEDLGNFLTGEETQGKQRKIVEQIDEMIRQAQQQQQSQCSSEQQQQSQKEQERAERDKQREERRKSQEELERERRQEQRQQLADPQDSQGDQNREEQRRVEKVKEVRVQGAGGDPAVQQGEEWGRLPARLREDVLDGRSRDFPERYRDLIERFYRRLAE